MGKLGLDSKPHDLPGKQACAAIGQCELMYTYDSLFSQYNHIVGQILIGTMSRKRTHKIDKF